MLNQRIRSNAILNTLIVPVGLALWMPFAQADGIIIDVKGMELTGGNITGGTICKDGGDCTAILKYKGKDGINTVVLKGGEIKAGVQVSGKITDGKIPDYSKIKIDNGTVSGTSLTDAKLTDTSISNVVISNAKVTSTTADLQNQTITKDIDKTLEATLTSGDISAATIDSVTLKASSSKAENAAAASGAATSATPQASDESDWKGDRITLRGDFKHIKAASEPKGQDYFAPDGADSDVVALDKKTDRLTVKFRGDSLDGSKACSDPSFFVPCWLWGKQSPARTDLPANTVEGHGTYLIDKSAIEAAPHLRRGWTFGALVVPFKYQLSDKSFSGSTTIGTYVGYKLQDNRGSITPILSAGWVPNIAVPLATGGSVNRSGFSWAGGVIFSIDKGTGTQIGILFGQDRLGSNAAAPYAYEGKTWMSLSIGYKFF